MENTHNNYMRSALWITGLSMAFSIGCTRKSAEEKKAEVKTEAAEDIAEVKEEGAENTAERREEVAEINTEAREDIADINKDAAEESKDAFGKAMGERLSVLDDRIETLEDKVDNKADTASVAMAPRLADIKAKREAASAQLDTIKGADDATWKNMRTGATQAFTDLENSLKSAEEAVLSH
jgi:hypothetical protein